MQETQETWGRFLSWEDPLEGMATHSSILAWRIPRTQDLVGYSPWGRRQWDTEASWHTHGFSGSHGDVGVGPRRRLSAKESMLSNCGAEEDYSESLGWHEDQACQF